MPFLHPDAVRTLTTALLTVIATGALLVAPGIATAAPAARRPLMSAPAGASCARATYIRPADGAIVTRVVCVLPLPAPAAGGAR